ncbi:hypothetical protein A3C86_00380 [Candidatus Kaiserbacteria bacterium RIFCSPHIGHO2_02_FULL_49_16]|uniref:EfeO-type cupredoxin-like domain-containing protein n=1 Tax=Candidatus Kaiserbacteria bacterium RIFCSPHIGHO2_02_FULL_49_16 TaxID=1798490 RepID=A0A1F6DHI2_9BACT|nr:MAG: hypothetical protein A3C86_00380 [Candidatus Kaiserbacteria bacterium RIFCSPHIGHO2_02_FULL_49_16]
MNKIILWVVGLLIIVGGWYLFTTDSNESADAVSDSAPQTEQAPVDAPEAVATSAQEVTLPVVIKFTDAGYVPSSVTIKKGQTVRWTNESGTNTWPASAVHPQHSAYPQKSASDCLGSSFDACRGLAQGESWDFKFDVVGEWKFHNHLNPTHRGSVTVTE